MGKTQKTWAKTNKFIKPSQLMSEEEIKQDLVKKVQAGTHCIVHTMEEADLPKLIKLVSHIFPLQQYKVRGNLMYYYKHPTHPELWKASHSLDKFIPIPLSFFFSAKSLPVKPVPFDVDFLESALNAYWLDAHTNLQRRDLGDIERKNYQYQLDKSKKTMEAISSLPPVPVKDVSVEECEKWCGLNYCDENGCMNRVRVPAPLSPKDVLVEEDFIVKEGMICPITKGHCDDECCTVGSVCNVSGNGLSAPKDVPVMQWVKASERLPEIRKTVFIKCWTQEDKSSKTFRVAGYYDGKDWWISSGEPLLALVTIEWLDENLKDVEGETK